MSAVLGWCIKIAEFFVPYFALCTYVLKPAMSASPDVDQGLEHEVEIAKGQRSAGQEKGNGHDAQTKAWPDTGSSRGFRASQETEQGHVRNTVDAFREFAKQEKARARQAQEAKRSSFEAKKKVDFNNLREFAANLKLKTPVPDDLLPILAEDEHKQIEIRKKAGDEFRKPGAEAYAAQLDNVAERLDDSEQRRRPIAETTAPGNLPSSSTLAEGPHSKQDLEVASQVVHRTREGEKSIIGVSPPSPPPRLSQIPKQRAAPTPCPLNVTDIALDSVGHSPRAPSYAEAAKWSSRSSSDKRVPRFLTQQTELSMPDKLELPPMDHNRSPTAFGRGEAEDMRTYAEPGEDSELFLISYSAIE